MEHSKYCTYSVDQHHDAMMGTLSMPSRFCKNATVFSSVSGPVFAAGIIGATAMMQQDQVTRQAGMRVQTTNECRGFTSTTDREALPANQQSLHLHLPAD